MGHKPAVDRISPFVLVAATTVISNVEFSGRQSEAFDGSLG
jgi:hypothetical protein